MLTLFYLHFSQDMGDFCQLISLKCSGSPAQVNVNFVLLTFLSRYGRFLLASLSSVLVARLRSMLTLLYLHFSPDMGDFC